MPLDVAEAPPLHKALQRAAPVVAEATEYLTTITRRPVDSRLQHGSFIETIQSEVNQLRGDIEQKFPNYPPARLEAMLDLVFGFYRLDKEVLAKGETKVDDYQKDISARIQHNLANHIIAASGANADPAFTDSMYAIASNTNHQVDGLRDKETSTLEQLWHGTRNEVAVVRTLMKNGYRVFLPDYMQDTAAISDVQNEVLQLDVRKGIDLLTISPSGNIILIDVKGRRSTVDVFEESKALEPQERTHPAIITALSRLQALVSENHRIYKTVVSVDAQGTSFRPSTLHMENRTPEARKAALAHFGELQQHVEADILEKLDRLEKESDYHKLPVVAN